MRRICPDRRTGRLIPDKQRLGLGRATPRGSSINPNQEPHHPDRHPANTHRASGVEKGYCAHSQRCCASNAPTWERPSSSPVGGDGRRRAWQRARRIGRLSFSRPETHQQQGESNVFKVLDKQPRADVYNIGLLSQLHWV